MLEDFYKIQTPYHNLLLVAGLSSKSVEGTENVGSGVNFTASGEAEFTVTCAYFGKYTLRLNDNGLLDTVYEPLCPRDKVQINELKERAEVFSSAIRNILNLNPNALKVN